MFGAVTTDAGVCLQAIPDGRRKGDREKNPREGLEDVTRPVHIERAESTNIAAGPDAVIIEGSPAARRSRSIGQDPAGSEQSLHDRSGQGNEHGCAIGPFWFGGGGGGKPGKGTLRPGGWRSGAGQASYDLTARQAPAA